MPSAVRSRSWDSAPMLALAECRSEARFGARLRAIVNEENWVIRLPDANYPSSPTISVPTDYPAARGVPVPSRGESNTVIALPDVTPKGPIGFLV
jgi:hypothetical protein